VIACHAPATCTCRARRHGYPRRTTCPAASAAGARWRRFGSAQFGVNLLELPPGAWSSQRHWHERQDEFVYVLEGEVTLVTDEGETRLTPACRGLSARPATAII
jgi:uncharacterized cupin superfamily protein